MGKYTIEEAREIFKGRGYELLEHEYKNCKTHMKYYCSYCDSTNSMSLDNMRRGKNCPNCSMFKTKDLQIIKYVESTKFELVDIIRERYTNDQSCIKVKLKCSKGHVFKTRWMTFCKNEDFECRVCRGLSVDSTKPKTHAEHKVEVLKYLKDNNLNYAFIGMEDFSYNGDGSKKYIKLILECPKHGRYEVEKMKFFQGSRCRKCWIDSITPTLEDIKNLVKESNFGEYEFVSDSYENMKTKHSVKHLKCGRQFEVNMDNFLNGNTGCPYCYIGGSKGEEYFGNYLKERNVEFTTQKTFEECKNINILPFDFAIYKKGELDFLIEIDGDQHRNPTSIFHKDIKDFEKLKLRDSIKDNYCLDNGIKLHRIEYKNIKDLNKWIDENKLLFS